MNNRLINWVNILSFGVGIYALYIALENLDMNNKQNSELKQILHYLEVHLQDQDEHLASQDKLLKKLTKGE